MMNAIARNALSAYSQVDMEVNVAVASPCKLVLLLYDGALKAISQAKFNMQNKKIAAKGEAISKAIAIIDEGLKLSLDVKAGGEIAENLSALYDYMCHRLLMANLKNDVDALDEVTRLLADLREAWAAIEKSPEVMGNRVPPAGRSEPARAANSFGRV
jgi:flagellar secretion chaperone FliS